MVVGTPSERPVKFAIRYKNRKVVDACKPCGHEPVLIELPVLIAIGAVPVARVIVPLLREAHRDAVPGERPQFLDEPVVQFLDPLAGEEGNDFVSPGDELLAVPPP